MKHTSTESSDYHQLDNSKDYYDEDDHISFLFESNQISFYYSNLSRYSKLIRDKYLLSDAQNSLPHDLQNFKGQQNINTENIILFFKLLQNELTINQNLTYKEYIDLYKISEFLQIKKLLFNLNHYFKNQTNAIDFQLQIILHETQINNDTENSHFKLNSQIEDLLSTKIIECLQNEKFSKIPVPFIFRIVEKSSRKQISSDLLYDFIKKDVKSFFVLFSFLDVEFLSDEKFFDLFESFTNPKGICRQYKDYLPCSLSCIMELKKDKKNLQEQLESVKQDKNQLQTKLSETESDKNQLQAKLNKTESDKNQLQTKISEIESERSQIQKALLDTEKVKNRIEKEKNLLQKQLDELNLLQNKLQKKINESEQKNSQLQKQLAAAINERDNLQKELDEYKCKIEGKIVATVQSDLIFYGQINLIENGSKLDKTRSKYIVSQSSEKSLGLSAYENGEPITSLDLTTVKFAGKSGTYFIRALVTDTKGKSVELVSNPVTTNGAALSFGYEGKLQAVSLVGGRYKIEVWGGQGGKSEGTSQGDGGLGGYSTGTLSLKKVTKIFVYVGGKGKTAGSSDGYETDGGFPDGGGTKTGHGGNDKAVPGTGGGSTSVRLLSDSLYSRVIVAGGGGGAAGDQGNRDHGGFGGGLSGGNSHCANKPKDEGAGTQTGSTPGPRGSGVAGSAGVFGKGATGLYLQGRNSGGGGGGGWYGGGSGGYGGKCNCSSGGGGSGWIFTESSYNNWVSGDSSNASQFMLDKSFYLADAITKSGDTSFPCPNGNNETGHKGDGYAKIIPV